MYPKVVIYKHSYTHTSASCDFNSSVCVCFGQIPKTKRKESFSIQLNNFIQVKCAAVYVYWQHMISVSAEFVFLWLFFHHSYMYACFPFYPCALEMSMCWICFGARVHDTNTHIYAARNLMILLCRSNDSNEAHIVYIHYHKYQWKFFFLSFKIMHFMVRSVDVLCDTIRLLLG